MDRPNHVLAAVFGALGILLIFAATVLGYATRSIFSERAFADRVTASLEDPRVAAFVTEQITDAVIKAKPDLIGVRPLLIGVGRSVVASAPFHAAVQRSARAMHRAIMSGAGTEIVLDVRDLGILIESLSVERPEILNRIPRGLSAALGSLRSLPGADRAVTLVRIAHRMRAGAIVLLILGLVLTVVSVWLSKERRRAIVRVGSALVISGLLLAIAARFGDGVVSQLARPEGAKPAWAGLASAFLGGLAYWGAALVFVGLVLAAASASLLERVQLARWAQGARTWLTGSQPLMRVRLLRGLAGVAVGAALLGWPLAALTVLGWLLGAVVVFAGMREAFIAALHMLPRIEAARAAGTPQRPERSAVRLVGAFALVLLAVPAWVVLFARPSAPGARETIACNGSRALCDRRLDQVVFPASHNAMSGADVPGWMFPSQTAGIRRQLHDGVRGFLIDVHYGVPVGRRVKTVLDDEAVALAKYEAAVGKEGLAAALRIRDRMAREKPGPRDVYACHGFCELGALPFTAMLRDMRDFLVTHPGEVLILVIQDESVTPRDVERCFRQSGLIDFVYRAPARPPWPTLGELVATDQRVLVMAENARADVAWYHHAFEVLQETPYTFRDTSEFSNAPHRGGTAGSLLLMNHWIETTPMPKPSNAAIVNARAALLGRIRAFQRARGRLPNLVAVDFYDVGDLLPVTRELNALPLSDTLGAGGAAP